MCVIVQAVWLLTFIVNLKANGANKIVQCSNKKCRAMHAHTHNHIRPQIHARTHTHMETHTRSLANVYLIGRKGQPNEISCNNFCSTLLCCIKYSNRICGISEGATKLPLLVSSLPTLPLFSPSLPCVANCASNRIYYIYIGISMYLARLFTLAFTLKQLTL